MRALTLERWALDPGLDTAGVPDEVPYAFTWTDTADPSDLKPYVFKWDTAEPKDWDTSAPDWNAGFQGITGGLGTGAAIGTAIGTVFPGIGNAAGGAIGAAVGAIGGFFAGLFGGKKGGGPPKPTPHWVADVLEEGRRALKEVPPNPSKMLDATFVAAGKLTREGYLNAKRAGRLPSQKFDQDRAAAKTKGRKLDAKFGAQIEANLQGFTLAEKALVSSAMPLGQGAATLDAIRSIRAQKASAAQGARASASLFFSPAAIERMRRQYLAPGAEPEPFQRAPELTAGAAAPPRPERSVRGDERDDDERDDDNDASGPAPTATAPTSSDLPKPLWHISQRPMPREFFEWLLYRVPGLRQLPKPLLRALAGKGSKVQDTSGIDAATRQYVMTPGETFAGIAAQLTGDPARAVELHAANPRWTPERVRIEIPPGWVEWTPLLIATGSDTGDVDEFGEDPPKKDDKADADTSKKADKPKADPPNKADKPAQRPKEDDNRANLTKRVITVLPNDYPERIAERTGAKALDLRWWRTLKSVNPHKVIAPNGNFQTLYAGELLNYPDTWPQHIEAKAAPGQIGFPSVPAGLPPTGGIIPPVMLPTEAQPTATPGTAPTGATADPGILACAQGILVVFAQLHPDVARPQDFGSQVADRMGVMTERTRSIISTFQLWWNTRKPSPMLRVDGILDSDTNNALIEFGQQAYREFPMPKTSASGGAAPASQSPSGQGTPSGTPSGGAGGGTPSTPGASGGGAGSSGSWIPHIFDSPWFPQPGGAAGSSGSWVPHVFDTPWSPQGSTPPIAPTTPTKTAPEDKSATGSKDDGAAALMVGGTILSLLLR